MRRDPGHVERDDRVSVVSGIVSGKQELHLGGPRAAAVEDHRQLHPLRHRREQREINF